MHLGFRGISRLMDQYFWTAFSNLSPKCAIFQESHLVPFLATTFAYTFNEQKILLFSRIFEIKFFMKLFILRSYELEKSCYCSVSARWSINKRIRNIKERKRFKYCSKISYEDNCIWIEKAVEIVIKLQIYI